MCPCGRTYHIENNPPKVDGVCDACGSKLYVREDDKEETVLERLKTYREQTSPLIDYYKNKGKLINIDGAKPIEETTRDIIAAIENIINK